MDAIRAVLPSVSLRSAYRVWQRDAIRFRRGLAQYVLPNFLEPVLYLFAIGVGIGFYVGTDIGGIPYVRFIAPGLAVSSAMYGAVFELTYNTYLKLDYSRAYDAVITTPVEPEDIALGELMWGATRASLYGTAFLTIVVALGHVASPWAAAAVVVMPLVGLTIGGLALIYTCLIRSMELFTYFFNLFVIPLFLFSGIFFPIERLPRWGRVLAWFTPLHHGVEATRALVLDGAPIRALPHLAWLAGVALLLLPPCLVLLRRRLVT